ncbi:hypothetical protein [Mycobacteroides abscessus]|uniref:hypothetical protein n=1 Tax=Mycobacteroides abscessus TaxID=36809 RepID=UPI0009D4209F|nr:hypothetical protein [Mycobacteroides abscessus]SKO15108.1 Uncharacterised protein [Mycobacteroides abscessus subsp. bolletii]SKX37464.1 Uncharacterised protein [Mycobacteroides abscessus subsp. bolletii]
MSETERRIVGDYLVVGTPGDYRVLENFGSYRALKKVFKTLPAAIARAQHMTHTRPNPR